MKWIGRNGLDEKALDEKALDENWADVYVHIEYTYTLSYAYGRQQKVES